MFRAPVDALRESSYHDNPEDFANEFYDDEDEDGAMTIIDEDGEETETGRYGAGSTRDSFYSGGQQGRDSFLTSTPYGGGNGDTNRYSMRFSVDRSSSTAYSGSQFSAHSPNKMRQSSVIAPHFFRTVSTVRSSSTLTSTTGGGSGGGGPGGGGFMAKRKFTKRAKRVAAIADSEEPEVYPKLQEVLTHIATKKEQELQLQRAKEVMEKALKVIQLQQATISGDVTPTHETKESGGAVVSSASLTPRTLSGTRTPPNPASRPVSTKLALDFPAVHDDHGVAASTTRHSLRLDSSMAAGTGSHPPASTVPDAILFPRDLDPKMRVSDHNIVLPAHIENGQLRPSSLSRSHSRESMTMMPPPASSSSSSGGMTAAMTAAALARANSSSSSGHRDSDLLLASMDPYIGDPQYKSLNILDNLELYFREQVFNPKRPSYPQIYLHEDLGRKEKLPAGLQHALCLIAAYHPDERLMTMFCEKVIDITALDSRSGGAAGGAAGAAAGAAAMAAGGDDDDDDDVAGGSGAAGGGAGGNNKLLQSTSVEKPMAIILSDQALYFIAMDEIASSYTFADAPVFTVQAHYPLYQLSVCTIYFGFQRCTLTFSHPAPVTKSTTTTAAAVAATSSTLTTTTTTANTSTSLGGGSHNAMQSPVVTALTSALSSSPVTSSTIPLSTPNSPSRSHLTTGAAASTSTATSNTSTASTMGTLIAKYMIITREKSRAYPLITRIPQVANQIRNNHQPNPLTNVKIENKDSQLIEQVTRYIQAQGDHDIVFYQMCFQTRSKAPTVLLPRSIILTQSLILLCYEDLWSTEVHLNVLECWKLKDIHKIAVDDNNPMQLVLTFAKRTNVIGNRKKWRITTDSRNASTKLLEELRRACNDLGNLLM